MATMTKKKPAKAKTAEQKNDKFCYGNKCAWDNFYWNLYLDIADATPPFDPATQPLEAYMMEKINAMPDQWERDIATWYFFERYTLTEGFPDARKSGLIGLALAECIGDRETIARFI